ncbi:unnamed protein product [Hymenolepis diminuta]|nr:unnamed protein product [Hymenolepis diminuta]
MLSSISEKFVMMVESSFEKWLDKHLKLSKQFCNEVAYGFVAQCYCSDLKVHAFAGMTASSGLCAALYSIVGGNEQIAQNLAAKALCSNPQGFPCHVSLNTTVTEISKGSKRRYRLTYVETDSETQKSEEFDYVVLAFPIHEKSVMKADPEIAQVLPEARPYVKVDFTHFHGDLSSQIFPLPKDELKDEGHSGVTILPTQRGYNEGGTPFKYFGRAFSTAPVQKGKKASGCFSALSLPGRTPNPGDEIPNKYVVSRCTLIDSTRWDAFPIFNPGDRNRLTKFVLADGLIYVNAIEQLASNMEFALIGGYNAALLIAEDRISRSN